MTTVLLSVAGIAGGSAVIYGEAGRKRVSRTFGVIAAGAFIGYVAAGGFR